MKTIYFILISVIISHVQFAQKLADVTLYFYDGSVLYGNAKMKDVINFTTNYGKISIPLRDISQINFGLEKDESIATDINKYIQILANASDEKNASAAAESISKYGLKAIYYLEKYSDNNAISKPENIQNLINAILATNNVYEYNFNDAITLNNGDIISGNIDFKTIEFVNSFLNTSISTYKIKNIDVFYTDSKNGFFSFILKASKHIMANNNGGWLNTGVKVKKGQSIEIAARGEIVLASLDNKKYTPDGVLVGSVDPPESSTDPTYYSYGTLIFKIGNNGKNLKAGSNTKYIADNDGVVYLTIHETVYSDKNTGAYQVKLSVK